jgi:hypothetical protein
LEVRSRLTRWWRAFANAVGGFFDEAAFRVALAFDILVGRVPQRTDKRPWIRSVETPVLVDCYDWTNDRLIFSVIVWPFLESSKQDASYDHHQRVEAVLDAIAKGAKEKMWSTRWELGYGLRWDHKRQVWTAQDGFSYEPPESDNRAAGVGRPGRGRVGRGRFFPAPAEPPRVGD